MIAFPVGFMFGLVAIPIVLGLSRWFGLYTVVGESQCQVFTLFGKVIGQIEETGFRFPFFGKKVRGQYRPQTTLPAWPNGQFRRRYAHGGRNLVRNESQ